MAAQDDADRPQIELQETIVFEAKSTCIPSTNYQSIQNQDAPHEGPTFGSLAQGWLNRALDYFSRASNAELCASFAGLGASTYLVLGRLGLVLMGVVGGIALHAAWEGETHHAQDGLDAKGVLSTRRREMGLDIVKRIWKWNDERQAAARDESPSSLPDSPKSLTLHHLEPETAQALHQFINAVISTNVSSWYQPMVPTDETFPQTCRNALTAFVQSLSSHLSHKRPNNMFMDLVTNSSSIVIVFLSELSLALGASPQADPAVALETYLDTNPHCSLARMLDGPQQDKKLDVMAEDMLSNYLDPKIYDCPPLHAFLKNALSKLVLTTTVQTCSQPDWINAWIVYLLEDGQSDLMQNIDVGSTDDRTKSRIGSTDQLIADKGNAARRENIDRAEDAMEEAMREAKRLTQLIVEEEAKKQQPPTLPALPDRRNDSISRSNSRSAPRSPMDGPSPTSFTFPRDDKSYPVVRPLSRTASSASTPRSIVTRRTSGTSVTLAPTTDNPPPPEHDDTRPAMTLVGAKISIFDDSVNGDTSKVKTKPTIEYLIQVEPASSAFSGWMTARRYADFEVLHEVLRRIATITGIRFTEKQPNIPPWKGQIKSNLRGDLERYLSDALKFQQLADSEGMKRFLDKDQSLANTKSFEASKGLGWPDPTVLNNVGKGVMDVLTKAPKNVAGGGKAFIDGVSNVLVGSEKRSGTPSRGQRSLNPNAAQVYPNANSNSLARMSQDSVGRSSFESSAARGSIDLGTRQSSSAWRQSTSHTSSQSYDDHESRPPSSGASRTKPANGSSGAVDAYDLSPIWPNCEASRQSFDDRISSDGRSSRDHGASTNILVTDTLKTGSMDSEWPQSRISRPGTTTTAPLSSRPRKAANPVLTEQETQVTIELVFAMITELYTLSSAWNFRRTLLTAAKTFLLRPGNPQLEAIRIMIQESVIDQNCSDKGMAALIGKARLSAAPTAEELRDWPAELTSTQKEELRIKARNLLVERGMPQALMSVMGATASGEALGKVFDCLQVEKVARSLVFGLLLQALRATVQ